MPSAPQEGIHRAIEGLIDQKEHPLTLLARLGPVALGSGIRRAHSWNREEKLVAAPEVSRAIVGREESWSEKLIRSRWATSRSASPPPRKRAGKERARSTTPPRTTGSDVEEGEFEDEFHTE